MEQNRSILLEALQNLPVYTPENEVWEDLEVYLTKNNFSDKLSQLSEIEPPNMIWDKIESELNFHEKFTNLNQYEPPKKIWENLDNLLSHKFQKPIKRRIGQLMIWTSTAAAILVLGFFIYTTSIVKNKNFNYSEEWLILNEEVRWNNNEYEVEQALILFCNENPKVCKSHDFKELNKELLILDQSKQTIEKYFNKYDTNAELDKMLLKIELERTSLIKEMIAKTL